jgi:RND family efflux transporter MFP subunit
MRLMPAQSMVDPGQPILRLHDMSETRVEIDVPERVFVAAGGLEHVRFAALDPFGREQPLRLVAFQPDASRVGQTYRVTLAFLSDPGSVLLPGASVTVMATLPTLSAGVTVPASALIAGNDRSASVLVLEGQGTTATLRRVEVGLAANGGTTFAVEGLEHGAEIVAAGAHRLAEGQTVRRFTGLRAAED